MPKPPLFRSDLVRFKAKHPLKVPWLGDNPQIGKLKKVRLPAQLRIEYFVLGHTNHQKPKLQLVAGTTDRRGKVL